ncbi:hypothetical protein B2G50_14880 [Leptospira interrogans serovar Canicola]|nr:hypothetical protein B2G50_14880 [Leptospira interrogans serovar Canicola]
MCRIYYKILKNSNELIYSVKFFEVLGKTLNIIISNYCVKSLYLLGTLRYFEIDYDKVITQIKKFTVQKTL